MFLATRWGVACALLSVSVRRRFSQDAFPRCSNKSRPALVVANLMEDDRA